MKKHVNIILLCILIMGIVIVLEIIGYKKGLTKLSAIYIIQTVFFVIWLGSAPMAYYTYLRLISESDIGGFKFANVAITCSNLAGIIFIPIILSPLLVIDYIKYFKRDLRKNCF